MSKELDAWKAFYEERNLEKQEAAQLDIALFEAIEKRLDALEEAAQLISLCAEDKPHNCGELGVYRIRPLDHKLYKALDKLDRASQRLNEREWLESQRVYPITSNDKGFWLCTLKRHWFPAIRYSVRCFLGYKHRWMHQVWMMQHFHPHHDRLFDDGKFEEAA